MSQIETQAMSKAVYKLRPNDVVTITVKMNGVSVALCNSAEEIAPRKKTSYIKKLFSKFNKNKTTITATNSDTETESMRAEVYALFKDFLPERAVVFGELIGYFPGTSVMIKEGYDYGCELGQYKFVPCKIVTKTPEGSYDWSTNEIQQWTENLIKNEPVLRSHLLSTQTIWHGRLKAFYPNLTNDEDWNTNVLDLLKLDRRLKLNVKEPLCKNNVVREGVVIRPDISKGFYVLKSTEFKK